MDLVVLALVAAVKALAYCSSRPGFDPRLRCNLLNHNNGSIAQSHSLSAAHPPDMTEILLKKDVIWQVISQHLFNSFSVITIAVNFQKFP